MSKAWIITDNTSIDLVFSASKSGEMGASAGVWISEQEHALKFFSENDALAFIKVFLRHHVEICRTKQIEVPDGK